jgi:hypothetical protein
VENLRDRLLRVTLNLIDSGGKFAGRNWRKEPVNRVIDLGQASLQQENCFAAFGQSLESKPFSGRGIVTLAGAVRLVECCSLKISATSFRKINVLPEAGVMVARQTPSFVLSLRRSAGLYASIASFVLGLAVLIPLGLVLSPFVLAYSRLGLSKRWASMTA